MQSVFLKNIINNIVPFIPGKINIYIGHIHSLRMNKTLKLQIVFKGIYLGNKQAIAHNGGCTGTSANSGIGLFYNIPHHQEIGGKAFFSDDGELVFDAFFYCGGRRGIIIRNSVFAIHYSQIPILYWISHLQSPIPLLRPCIY